MVVGVLELSGGDFNIPLTSPKDVLAMTAEAELTAEPWNGGRVQTGEPRSLHPRVSHENNRHYPSSFSCAFVTNKIDNLVSFYILLAIRDR
jgi:hypothetical protein